MNAAMGLAGMAVMFMAGAQGAEPRLFEGVNLAELKQAQRLSDLPELYERAPGAARFQMRKAVVQIPLGNAWLSFNADRNVSYLHKLPGEDPATYFGPIEGDAFERFRLEERFTNALRKDYAPDVEYRVALMVRSGNEQMRARALRIMRAALAPEVDVRTRASHLPRFRELIAGLEGDDVAPVRAAIAETEQRISDATPTYPGSAYSPGHEALAREGKLLDWMKAPAVPEAAWGEAVNGLRAAAVYSTTTPKMGEAINVWLVVENPSKQVVRFSAHDVVQTAQPKIVGPDGKAVQGRGSFYTGLSPIQRYKLQPGERLTVAKKTLVFEEANSGAAATFGQNRVPAKPGEYRVRYENILGIGTAKGEQSGLLSTAETSLTVTRGAGQ